MGRALDARAGAPSTTFVDVAYRDLVHDPVQAVGAVYRQLGRELDGDLEVGLRRWVAANPRHKHGPHRYDLARFGLTEQGVEAAFERYLAGFGAVVAG
jgi:hypothetical protein